MITIRRSTPKVLSKLLLDRLEALVAVVLVAAGLRLLYQAPVSPFAKEVVASSIAALITVAATAALLHAQTEGQLHKEKSVGVFQAKLKMYSEFVEFLNKIIEDDVIEEHELKQLSEWGLKISLVAGNQVVESINRFISQVILLREFHYGKLDQEQIVQWKQWHKDVCKVDPDDPERSGLEEMLFVSVGAVIGGLRTDLGERFISVDQNRDLTRHTVDELLSLRNASGWSAAAPSGSKTPGS